MSEGTSWVGSGPYVSSTKQPLMNFSWVIKIGVPFHDYAVIMQILVPFGILSFPPIFLDKVL